MQKRFGYFELSTYPLSSEFYDCNLIIREFDLFYYFFFFEIWYLSFQFFWMCPIIYLHNAIFILWLCCVLFLLVLVACIISYFLEHLCVTFLDGYSSKIYRSFNSESCYSQVYFHHLSQLLLNKTATVIATCFQLAVVCLFFLKGLDKRN